MNTLTATIISLSLLIGCAAAPPPLTQEQRQENDRILKEPTNVVVSAHAAPYVWARTQSWVAQNSTMKIQTANDVLIDTYNPTSYGFGYHVVKTPMPDGSVTIAVAATSAGDPVNAGQLAHFLAHYIRQWAAEADATK